MHFFRPTYDPNVPQWEMVLLNTTDRHAIESALTRGWEPFTALSSAIGFKRRIRKEHPEDAVPAG